MSTFYEKFATDKGAENQEGVILDYGSAGKIRIHRAGGSNEKFKRFAQATLKPYTRQMQSGTMDDEVARGLMIKVYARTVITGWEGVKGKDGKDLSFTEDNVIQLMTDLPDLFDDIQKAAQDHSLFLSQIREDVEGNSKKPSAGTSSTATQ